MAEKTCSLDDNNTSATDAWTETGSGNAYGPAYVEVIAVENNTVKFLAAGSGGTGAVEVKCTWTHANVWPRCPSSLDCDDHRLPVVGAKGTLYLSRSLVEHYHLSAVIKWPDDLAGGIEYKPLRIWPTSIELTGVELATGKLAMRTVDLMDRGLVEPGQTITFQDQPLTINLSRVAFNRFLVAFPSLEALQAAQRTISAGNAKHSATELAAAWTQVAAWEQELRDHRIRDTLNGVAAQKILNALRG